MRIGYQAVVVCVAGAALASCGDHAPSPSNEAVANAPDVATAEPAPTGAWQYLASGEGSALRFTAADGAPVLHLFCKSRSGRLLANVPAFKPIGSEERLSLGSGGTVVALVADTAGDAQRGGVSGEGPVPAELGAILSGPVSVSYGAQSAGPLAPPEAADRAAFVTACGEKRAPVPPNPAPAASACFIQDGERLTMTPLRAIGTEPFWGARIEGRCVTYSTPEDQAGTRVWTRFTPGPDGGTWAGALGGRQFDLRTRPAAPPGCSDGMSDNRYPHHVTLRVMGETRTGCAKPL